MKLITKKQIEQFALKHKVPYWKVEKVMFELNTQDSNLLDKYFSNHSFEDKIKEMNVRVNEISIYLQQSRTISKEEWFPINVRIGHLKEDTKNFAEDFAYLEPNLIGKIKQYLKDNLELLLSKDKTQEEFVIGIEMILNDIKDVTTKQNSKD